jgi:hypothetical protein
MILTDPFELIKSMPSGSALYGRAGFQPGEMASSPEGESAINLETCILIREDEKQIRKIPANPIVELRSGIWENHICIVVVMIKLAGLPYETWWNYYAEGDYGKISFDDMIRQAMIPILIYDHRERHRSIGVRNSLQLSFKKYKETIARKPAWGMKEFDAVREIIYASYPTVTKLWETLDADLS